MEGEEEGGGEERGRRGGGREEGHDLSLGVAQRQRDERGAFQQGSRVLKRERFTGGVKHIPARERFKDRNLGQNRPLWLRIQGKEFWAQHTLPWLCSHSRATRSYEGACRA